MNIRTTIAAALLMLAMHGYGLAATIDTKCTFERSSNPDLLLGQAPLLLSMKNDGKTDGNWGGTDISDLKYDAALDEWKGTFWGNQFRYKNWKVDVLNPRTSVVLVWFQQQGPGPKLDFHQISVRIRRGCRLRVLLLRQPRRRLSSS